MKIAVFIANGTEEIEALTPVDVLRRGGAEVELVSVNGEYPKGSHGIVVKADKVIEETDFSAYDAVVIPGGMPGATNISENALATEAIKAMNAENKLVAAICASPAVVLKKLGVIEGKKATCYPADTFINELGDGYTGSDVEEDGNVITANGPKSAMKFTLAICNKLGLNPKF